MNDNTPRLPKLHPNVKKARARKAAAAAAVKQAGTPHSQESGAREEIETVLVAVQIKTLLEFGADVDACGVDGRTPLIHAARTDNIDFAFILLQFNANINAMSTACHTPLTTAIVHNSHSVLSLLLERWDQYSICPRLKGPHLLRITAQYADLDTMIILRDTNHFRVKHDKVYCTGDFDTLLSQRLDATKSMEEVFVELMSVVREQASLQSEPTGSVMEKGFVASTSATCPLLDDDEPVGFASEKDDAPPRYTEKFQT